MTAPNGLYFDMDRPLGIVGNSFLLRDLDRIRELRLSTRCSLQALARLEEQGGGNVEAVEAERAYLDATHREIQRLERKVLYSEFGFL